MKVIFQRSQVYLFMHVREVKKRENKERKKEREKRTFFNRNPYVVNAFFYIMQDFFSLKLSEGTLLLFITIIITFTKRSNWPIK